MTLQVISQQEQLLGLGALPLGAFRNRIINGDFAINQRQAMGTNVSCSVGTPAYGADRWVLTSNSGPPNILLAQQNENISPGDFHLLLYANGVETPLAATAIYACRHRLEGYSCRGLYWGSAAAKPITISFETVGGAPASATYSLLVRNPATTRSWLGSFTVNASSVWEKKVFTVPGETTGVWPTDSGHGMDVLIGLGVGTTYQGVPGWQSANVLGLPGMTNLMGAATQHFYLRKFQLEEGPVATEFERVPYDVQLQRCQRYYWKRLAAQAYERVGGAGQAYSAASAAFSLPAPVTMRVPPTVGMSGGAALTPAGSVIAGTTVTQAQSDPNTLGFNMAVGPATWALGDATLFLLATAGSSFIEANAELI